MGDDELYGESGRAKLGRAESDIDESVLIVGYDAFEGLDAEGWILLHDLDHVLEFDGRGASHAKAARQTFAHG